MRWAIVAAALALYAPMAGAAERPPPLPDMFMNVFEAPKKVGDLSKPWFQSRQQLAMVGRDDLIVDLLYSTTARPPCEPLKRSGKIVDPLSEIIMRAKASGRIVMFNEAHDDAQTRVLIMQAMQPLRDLGFSVYGAETFMRSVGSRSPKWPLLTDGFYSYEPTFGELLRLARRLDFEFVAYEADEPRKAPENDVAARIAERETSQTKNIMARIIAPKPGAKILLHVGHHHLIEEPVKNGLGGENRWMASRLKEASGIDPLTVDQTTFQSPIDQPVICALTSDAEKKRALAVDITVALPKPKISEGRPIWRRAMGRWDVTIPDRLLSTKVSSIVEARYASEPAEAVPADRLLLAPGEKLPLLLKPGTYRIEAWTRESGWSAPIEIPVIGMNRR
jgi:hypothetical protein